MIGTESMSTLEYLAIIAFIDWCGTHPPNWHPPRLPQEFSDPTKEMQGWMSKPWVAQAINQFYFIILGGLIVIAVMTHPVAAVSLKWGPLMCVPAYRVLIALLPAYKPYPGAWDRVKEGVGKTPIPGAFDKAKDAAERNPIAQGLMGKKES